MATTDLGKWMITNGGDYDPDVTYEKLTMVMYDNSTYITLKTVTGVTPSNDQINYALMARGFDPGVLSSVTAVDTSGALGNAGETVSAQSLVDYLADAVMTKLVEKANISNVQVNDTSKVPSAALAYAMQQQITENEDAISVLNSDLNSRTAVSDLNTVVDSSPHTPLIVQCDINTLNTPYKSGLTSAASGTAYITGGSDSNYTTMFYIPASDPNMFIRTRANGTWYDWGRIIINADLKGFKFSKSLDIDIMTTFSCNLPPSFALVWGGIRSGGTEDNESLFFILVDSTQGKFSYTPILTGEIESVEWLNSQLTITFTRASYWQINAIYVDAVG